MAHQTGGKNGELPQPEKRLNVLHLRASPFLGSPERLLLSQLRHLDNRQFSYVIGAFDEQLGGKNDFLEAVRQQHTKGYAIPANIFLFIFTFIRLMNLVRSEQIHLICAHDFKSDFFGLLVGALCKLPRIAVFHGKTGLGVKLRLYERFDDYLLPYFSRVIAVSSAIKEKLQRMGLREERIRVISNGIDLMDEPPAGEQDSARQEIGISPCDPVILYAGRLSREKGLHVLIDAATEVLKSAPRAKFVILGQGPEGNPLKRRVETLGLENSFAFLGFRKNIQPFLSVMDVCVLPSFTEGMPLVILEAFANQKPVVASRVGGIPDLIQDGVTGILVEAGNPEELARGIVRLLNNRELASAMGKAGRELVRRQYSVGRQVEEYCKVFTEVSQGAN